MSDTIHMVDVNNAQSLGLLAKAYKAVYAAEFPPEERESMDEWIETMSGNNDFVDMVIAIAGENLESSKPILKGFTVGYYYKKHSSGLVAYTVVPASYQGLGLEQAMLETTTESLNGIARNSGNAINGVFIELGDPATITSPQESADASARLNFFKSIGAKEVNITFVEPPVTGDDKKSPLKLVAFPGKDGVYPTRQEVKNFLTGIYDGLAEFLPGPFEKDTDYVTAMRQAETASQLYLEPTAKARAAALGTPGR